MHTKNDEAILREFSEALGQALRRALNDMEDRATAEWQAPLSLTNHWRYILGPRNPENLRFCRVVRGMRNRLSKALTSWYTSTKSTLVFGVYCVSIEVHDEGGEPLWLGASMGIHGPFTAIPECREDLSRNCFIGREVQKDNTQSQREFRKKEERLQEETLRMAKQVSKRDSTLFLNQF